VLPEKVVAVETCRDVQVELFPAEADLIATRSRGAVKNSRRHAIARGSAWAAWVSGPHLSCGLRDERQCGRLAWWAASPTALDTGRPPWPWPTTSGRSASTPNRTPACLRASRQVARGRERDLLRTLAVERGDIAWDRVLYSAKETVFKAWFPPTGVWLEFADVGIVIDGQSGWFDASFRYPLRCSHRLDMRGRFLVQRGMIVTAIAIAR
jgi:hypothetical protein